MLRSQSRVITFDNRNADHFSMNTVLLRTAWELSVNN